MEASQIYISIAILALLIIIIAVFLVRKNKKREKLTPLTIIALVFVLAGPFFGDNRLIAYGLIGIGLLLAVIDIIKKSRKKK